MGLRKIDKREEERGGTPGRMPKKQNHKNMVQGLKGLDGKTN
jgi:hypothetical protein